MSDSYLITGGTGFVGSCIARRLINLGKTVHIISRHPESSWRLGNIKNKISFHKTDFLDKDLSALLHRINPSYVFHLAAYGTLPHESLIGKMVETNLFGTINLIHSLDFKKVKLFINTGSSSEYATKSRGLKENDLLQPANDYGVSKVAQTLYCQKEAKIKNLPIITFRLFSPYGFYEEGTRLIPHVILKSLKNQDIQLSNKYFVRDFIFIEDVIDAYLKACEYTPDPGEIFNIGSSRQHSIGEVVSTILALTNTNAKPIWGSIEKQQRQTEPNTWRANILHSKKTLNWSPKYTFEQGLEQTIDWFKDYQKLYA